jgi:putative phage-type endonuclease
MSAIGVGASDVGTLLHLSPWSSAYELWSIKTGRRPKPETTEAMEFGTQMEGTAFERYVTITGRISMQRQVAAQHPDFDYLRCVADGWDGKHGVEIKCPTSSRLAEQVRRGLMPPHYTLQCLTMMEIFGVAEWDFFVYDPSGGEFTKVTLADPVPWWEGTASLEEFWATVALPAIGAFWGRICADTWHEDGVPAVDDGRWDLAVQKRRYAMQMIEEWEDRKLAADAELKHMVGGARSATAAGFRAAWSTWAQKYEIKISCADEAKMTEIYKALHVIQCTTGVKSVKAGIQYENRVFRVTEEKP